MPYERQQHITRYTHLVGLFTKRANGGAAAAVEETERTTTSMQIGKRLNDERRHAKPECNIIQKERPPNSQDGEGTHCYAQNGAHIHKWRRCGGAEKEQRRRRQKVIRAWMESFYSWGLDGDAILNYVKESLCCSGGLKHPPTQPLCTLYYYDDMCGSWISILLLPFASWELSGSFTGGGQDELDIICSRRGDLSSCLAFFYSWQGTWHLLADEEAGNGERRRVEWPFLQTFTYDSNWIHSGEFMTSIVHDEYLCPIQRKTETGHSSTDDRL